MVRMYFEWLFNDHVWKPEELMCKFSDDIELLKEVYLCTIRLDSHTDYDGEFIKCFISVDNSWVQLYAEYIIEMKIGHICMNMIELWHAGNWITI